MKLDLQKPIFVLYINVLETDSEHYEAVREMFSFKDCTFWILPVQGETKIELIWQGSKYSTNPGIVTQDPSLVHYLHEILEVVIGGTEDHEIKQSLRDLKLRKILV